jgi:hypothetical protein
MLIVVSELEMGGLARSRQCSSAMQSSNFRSAELQKDVHNG